MVSGVCLEFLRSFCLKEWLAIVARWRHCLQASLNSKELFDGSFDLQFTLVARIRSYFGG